LGAWLLHVGALALAPLSIVQAVLSGGLVFLAILAERCFGFHLGQRQWIGLVTTAAGLVVVGLTSTEHSVGRSSLAALIAVECGVMACGGLLVLGSVKLDNTHRDEGMMLAVVAFFASARSLQLGPGLVVIALTSVAANVVAISGGILVFHDPTGAGHRRSWSVCSRSASWSSAPG
jgi:drug/metabolite transporter (DMT)-like permease